jgi:hypothetical protein
MNDEFQIGDTVKTSGNAMRGFVTDKDTYVDVYGDGHVITDYWIGNSDIKFSGSQMFSTRMVLTEKTRKKRELQLEKVQEQTNE